MNVPLRSAMQICLRSRPGLELSLLRGRVLGLDSATPVEVACVEGSVWITVPEGVDIVLGVDERVTVPPRGRLVVQALTAARFRLHDAA